MHHLVVALAVLVALPAVVSRAQSQCNRPFFANKTLCERENKLCGQSRTHPGCWSPVESFRVPGQTSRGNPVIFKMPANATARVERIDGSTCPLPGVPTVCGGANGYDKEGCNQVSDECVCPLPCPSAPVGALMRDACVRVQPGTFATGDGRHVFFINTDCNPSNNTGQLQVKLSY